MCVCVNGERERAGVSAPFTLVDTHSQNGLCVNPKPYTTTTTPITSTTTTLLVARRVDDIRDVSRCV